MAVLNNNLKMIDRPIWEQCTSAIGNSAAGSCMVDDGERFIYYLLAANSFWAYDTWSDTWQQLASAPGGTVAAGTCIRFVREMGSQENGVVYGSVYALIASGTTVTFYRYNIGNNTWTAALSVTGVPATFGTDGRLTCVEPAINAYQGGYHSAVSLNTVTLTATASPGATTLAVAALPLGLPASAVLNFGTYQAPKWAVLTAAAAASATSLTVSPLVSSIESASVSYWYADMFLFGNASSTFYRYNITGNQWFTTSANAANPALAAVPGTAGAGTIAAWLPGSGDANALDRIILFRGTATSSAYEYSLSSNTWSTLTFYPSTDTFSSGTSSAVRSTSGKNAKLVLGKDTTGRFYQFDREAHRMTPLATQSLVASGAAVVGDKSAMLMSPDGIEFLYVIPSTSTFLMRTGMIL